MPANEVTKYLSENGKKGGSTTLKRHGKEHFKEISKKALEKRWGSKKSAKPSKSV